MALRTFDICHTVTALKQRGMNFLKVPPQLP
jgi:4-hydroxyphenylpyruvate dioxygenase-like putative hemolysin